MKRIALALLCLTVLAASLVAAQDAMLGLSADDALLLAAANSTPLDSFAFDYTLHLAEDLDTFAVSADFSGSGAVDRTTPALMATVSGQVTLGNTQTIPLNAEARLLGGSLYLNNGDGWQALEAAATAAADLIGDFTGLSVDTAVLSGWNLYGVDGLDDFMMAIAGADPALFLSAERLADENVGDVLTAHFQITADLHALIDSDAFVDAFVALSQAQGSDLIIRTRDEVAEMLRADNRAGDLTTLTIEEYVGLDDHLIHRMVVTLDMQIAPLEADYSSPPFTVNLSFDATLSEHNQPQMIPMPDGANTVSEFTVPMPAPEALGDGVTQYMFFGALDENTTYTQVFDLQEGDILTITARRLSLELDTNLRLLSPDGDILLENDDHETSPFLASGYDSQIFNYTVPETGTYSIQVTDLYGGMGSFILTVNIER